MATLMKKEIGEIPSVIERQSNERMETYVKIGRTLIQREGSFVTNARGTSNFAASYFKSLTEIKSGRMVTSLSPSVSSVYNSKLHLEDGVMLSISQSGRSPDLISSQQAAQKAGALTVALSNHTESILAKEAELSADILAGKEQAVAATKTFVACLFACYGIVQGMLGNEVKYDFTPLYQALKSERLNEENSALKILHEANSVFTISRGAGLAVAQEAALKLKETCQIHAEAFSAAEVIHGPMVLAKKGIAVIVFETNDRGQKSIDEAIYQMASNGAKIIRISTDYDLMDSDMVPLVQITQFYGLVEKLSVGLGFDPDVPPMLKKVTETV